jgi:hypothetical protein
VHACLAVFVSVNKADDVSSACRAASSGGLHAHSVKVSAGQSGRTAITHARRMRRRVATLTIAEELSSEKETKEEKEEEEQENSRVTESSGEEESDAEVVGETQRMTVTAQRREYLLATSGKRADKDPFLSAWCASACMGVGAQGIMHIQRRLRAFLVCRQELPL